MIKMARLNSMNEKLQKRELYPGSALNVVRCNHVTVQINLTLRITLSDVNIYDRLLVLCLLENKGVLQIAREFGSPSKSKGLTDEWMKPNVSRIAQIVVSIPDKARMNSSTSLSSQYPFIPFVLIVYWFHILTWFCSFFYLIRYLFV
jgi:hypothetical protein